MGDPIKVQDLAREMIKLSGRTQEIQRLIGRSLRSVLDLDSLGEKTFLVDCDVIQADAGTRTASITGSWIALQRACSILLEQGKIKKQPIFITRSFQSLI